ncbi:unnamed protein product, partial [Vitis vinifera]
MGRRVVHYFLFLLLGLLICSGSTERGEMGQKKEGYGTEKQLHSSSSISITQKDITTPITTVPTVNPTTPSSTTPPVNPDSTPASNPATTTTPTSSGASCLQAVVTTPTPFVIMLLLHSMTITRRTQFQLAVILEELLLSPAPTPVLGHASTLQLARVHRF